MWEGGRVLLFTTECLFLTWLDKYSREVRMEFHDKFRVDGDEKYGNIRGSGRKDVLRM